MTFKKLNAALITMENESAEATHYKIENNKDMRQIERKKDCSR